MKEYKGDKYIYLLMGYMLARQSKDNSVVIGHDNGFTGGQNYYRVFTIQKYDGKELLIEKKTARSFADFSRVYEVISGSKTDNKPYIREYINESGDNCSKTWVH